jgi:hypothetical protein
MTKIKIGDLVKVKKYGWIMRVDSIKMSEGRKLFKLGNSSSGTGNGNTGDYLFSELTKQIYPKLRGVKVTYSDGTVISTSMAAHLTNSDIKNYFKKGKMFNVGTGGNDKIAAVKSVRILA